MVFFLLGNCFLQALEAGFMGGIENLTFHPDRITAHGQSLNYKPFKEYPFGFGEFYIKGEFSGKLGFIINGVRDSILRNSISAAISLKTDYFDISAGPIFGMDDNLNDMEMGVMGSIGFAYPGIIFVSINGSKTFGSYLEFLSKNTRLAAEAKLGIWLPNIIPYLSASFKTYDRPLDNSVTISDEQIRLQLNVEIFAKNFPLIIRLEGGYEILSRTYKRETSITDELNAIYAGFDIKLQISKPFKFILGCEMPVYCKAKETMENPENILKLFKAYGGMVFTIF
jgi:hypothetical protein